MLRDAIALARLKRRRSAAIGTVLLAIVSVAAQAQKHVLTVSVADAETGRPIEGAQVRLPDSGRIAITNWIGEALFNDASPGPILAQVRMIGYAPSEVRVLVRGDSTGAFFALEATPAQTDTVKVFAERTKVASKLFEFEAHKTMGIARILPESVLANAEPDRLSLMLATHFPGLVMRFARGHTTVASLRHGGCGVKMFLDGILMDEERYFMLDPRDLAGVEYYPVSMAPVQYRHPLTRPSDAGQGGDGPACAVLLFWSK
jgi:hypothetical protein